MWGVIFSYGGVWGVCPPPPTPVLQIIVLAHMPHPMGARRSFQRGVGNPKKPLIKTKKDIKTKNRPPPHGEKIVKIRPPHGDKRGKLKAPTWRKVTKCPPIYWGNFSSFSGEACAYSCTPSPLRASMPQSPSNIVEYSAL